MSEIRPTVYVHIGRGKTGSTSFQSFCGTHRDFLHSRGYFFPFTAGAETLRGHDTFAKAHVDSFPTYMKQPKNVPEAMEELSTLLRATNSQRIIISSEQLEVANPQKVRVYFESVLNNPVFKIFYTVRQQDELAESEYNQLLKIGRFVGTFPEFLASMFEANYFEIAEAWAEVFGQKNVHCLPYYPGQDSTRVLLEACELDTSSLPKVTEERKNRSLKMEQLIAIRNLYLLGLKNVSPTISELRDAEFQIGTPALFFDSHEARAFRAQYAESNRQLISKYMRPEQTEIGGRRYSDGKRDEVRKSVMGLNVV